MTAYEMRISDWSSDVCSSDLVGSVRVLRLLHHGPGRLLPSANCPAHTGMVGTGSADEGRQMLVDLRRQGLVHALHQRLGHREPHLLAEIGRASCRERVCQYV